MFDIKREKLFIFFLFIAKEGSFYIII